MKNRIKIPLPRSIVWFCAVVASIAVLLYLNMRSHAQIYIANGKTMLSDEIPSVVRDVGFEGPITWCEYRTFGARTHGFLIAGKVPSKLIENFFSNQGLTVMLSFKADYIIKYFGIKDPAFVLTCGNLDLEAPIGWLKDAPGWKLEGNYCSSTGRVVLQIDRLSDR
jgi:hypothetical protein